MTVRISQDSTIDSEQAEERTGLDDFSETLTRHELELKRDETRTLQINVGLICNQSCAHCHLEAGPDRVEIMSLETMEQVIAYAKRVRFHVIDITGGAPEMNPHLPFLIDHIAPLTSRVMLRSNLTAIAERQSDELLRICVEHRVAIVASFPSVNAAQTEAQRGKGVAEKSIKTLRKLNDLGYGREGTGLELDLVSSPTGAFLPPSQAGAEKQFKRELQRKWGIVFNNLYTFANVPLGRYRRWLKRSGNLEHYLEKLSGSFNPCTIEGLMCRSLVSVSWDGYLFDCDFNQARRLFMGNQKRHISEMTRSPDPGSPIAVGDHCYACTAGSGFT